MCPEKLFYWVFGLLIYVFFLWTFLMIILYYCLWADLVKAISVHLESVESEGVVSKLNDNALLLYQDCLVAFNRYNRTVSILFSMFFFRKVVFYLWAFFARLFFYILSTPLCQRILSFFQIKDSASVFNARLSDDFKPYSHFIWYFITHLGELLVIVFLTTTFLIGSTPLLKPLYILFLFKLYTKVCTLFLCYKIFAGLFCFSLIVCFLNWFVNYKFSN